MPIARLFVPPLSIGEEASQALQLCVFAGQLLLDLTLAEHAPPVTCVDACQHPLQADRNLDLRTLPAAIPVRFPGAVDALHQAPGADALGQEAAGGIERHVLRYTGSRVAVT